MRKSLVTLEFSTIIVRLHNEPAEWGEFKPYDGGFILVQVAPQVYEAKLAKEIDFKPSHQKALKRQLIQIGAEKVFLWRHKAGEEPYKIVITKDRIYRETAQIPGDSKAF